MEREIIQPVKQDVWGWPAATNFILGGMGASYYLLSLLARVSGGVFAEPGHAENFKIVGPALTVLGLSLLALEAGRPLRSRFLLSHLRWSWMSRETLAAGMFVGCAIFDWYNPDQVALYVGALGAVLFLLSQSFIVYEARGVAAWNVALVPVVFLISGFFSGSGLLLLDSAWGGRIPGPSVGAITLFLLAVNLLLWLLYLNRRRSESPSGYAKALLRPFSLLLTVGIGHLLPGILLLTLLTTPEKADRGIALILVSGLAVILGGAAQKAGILLKAGYLREIVIDRCTGVF